MPLGEIFKTANDRLKSPFLSSFIFSWIAFNWKSIFVVFAGNENVYTRIRCVESDYIDFYSAFLYPLLVALFYTLAFPFITVFFQWVTEKARIWSSQLKYKREILESEDKETLAKTEFKIEQAKAGTNELKELNDQIGKLKEDLEKTKSENATYKTQVNTLNENLKEEKLRVTIFNTDVNSFRDNEMQLENELKNLKTKNSELSTSLESKKEIMDKSLELASKIKRWVTPYNTTGITHMSTYDQIRKKPKALSFLDSTGEEIEKNYSIDLNHSDQNDGYKLLRQLKLFRVISDNDNIHTITFNEIGKNIWEIRKFALRDGRELLFPKS